mmetsp:Transcript_9806/g.17076  ORF Transcript_9806/g.17076 Transcript_9806/m.17076 type:complete len:318 (-) Transcript_9806:237-1190(-)|eukprot:CAMPEP_0196658618 /NCGR_PEP_ID=MMETSP1086-20130531/30592_1 /TAXON_ID=77921 /ORGANISM="Cyanoptyche  gloeocystis , Strain SAG4.97" /LENGTH=317 /DNA_ID=CAMNT_0041992261 /DNA_START=802 /DNA_END=1755 /DNA_ORIENTATION=+
MVRDDGRDVTIFCSGGGDASSLARATVVTRSRRVPGRSALDDLIHAEIGRVDAADGSEAITGVSNVRTVSSQRGRPLCLGHLFNALVRDCVIPCLQQLKRVKQPVLGEKRANRHFLIGGCGIRNDVEDELLGLLHVKPVGQPVEMPGDEVIEVEAEDNTGGGDEAILVAGDRVPFKWDPAGKDAVDEVHDFHQRRLDIDKDISLDVIGAIVRALDRDVIELEGVKLAELDGAPPGSGRVVILPQIGDCEFVSNELGIFVAESSKNRGCSADMVDVIMGIDKLSNWLVGETFNLRDNCGGQARRSINQHNPATVNQEE